MVMIMTMTVSVVVVMMMMMVSTQTTPTTLLVIGDQRILDQNPGSMGIQIVGHVILLQLHVVAKLVKTAGANLVALAIDLPSNGRVLRTDLVVTGCTSRGPRVVVNVLAHIVASILHPTTNHVRVKVRLVIDNGKDLGLHAHGRSNILSAQGGEHFQRQVTKDAIVEGRLVLIGGTAGACG